MLSNEQLISYSKWAVSGYQQQCRYQKKPTHKKHIHIHFLFFRERKSSKCEESEMKKKKKTNPWWPLTLYFHIEPTIQVQAFACERGLENRAADSTYP